MKQVFYKSKDGTRVPMFVAHKKGFEHDGRSPLWMYGYGHGGWVAFPWFQAHLVAWMDLGGVYALPGIRGGGEYGAEWADAGMRRNKQNAIDDYIAAAEWLIENRYTSPDGLVANGGSASGVMPAAAINQRPELFGAAVIDMPFLDMLRYHKFSLGFTSGYGSPEDPEDFKVLRAYSPYHNLKPGICYPPMLISVAERDQSTAPLHGYKFIAALQAAQSCGRPVLMQQIWGAGHYTFGTTREQRNETLANQIVFLVRALGIEVADESTRTAEP
ncbi:MAG: S9 family peptidase [Planctomycetes bacterium]|nr:S9 family peptidase [Planctomycetota bacterium]